MKLKTTLIAVLLFLGTGLAYSQTNLSLGVEAGLNLANVSITPSVTTNSRTGFIIGGVVDVGFTPQIGMVSGLRFIMKGFETTNFGTTTVSRASFFEIPALLKVKFPLTDIKPYVIAGPTLGLKLSATIRHDQGGQGGSDQDDTNAESIDFGLFFGAGLDFNIAPKTDLFFQTGYALGLSNLSKAPGQTVKSNGIQLVVGAKFKM